MEASLATGLRIGDVLELRTEAVRNTKDGRITVRELKTGKIKHIKLTNGLQARLLAFAGKVYIFEHRMDWRRHRTRQAVYKDLKRVAQAFRIKPNIAPHTARKVWAVDQYHKDGDLKRVQRLLNHSSEAVTMLYAMADQVAARKQAPRPAGRKSAPSGA